MQRLTYLLPASLAGCLGWPAEAVAQQGGSEYGTPPAGGDAPAGAAGQSAPGDAAVNVAPPAVRPESQGVTIDREGGLTDSPAVADEGFATWLWVVIAVIAVLVVLALLKVLIGSGRRV